MNKPIETIRLGYMSIAKGKWWCPDKSKIEAERLGAEIVIPQTTARLIYDYPFRGEFPFEYTSTSSNGFTRREISEKIIGEYKKIYAEEERVAGDPGCIPGMYNRAQSNGPYQIWGHYISDLYLHSIYRMPNGDYRIGFDS